VGSDRYLANHPPQAKASSDEQQDFNRRNQHEKYYLGEAIWAGLTVTAFVVNPPHLFALAYASRLGVG
jgi:hypothetical protein